MTQRLDEAGKAAYRASLKGKGPHAPRPKPRPLRPRGADPRVERGPGFVRVTLALRLGRGANAREHHYARSRRVKAERQAVGLALRLAGPPPAAERYRILLVRCAPGVGLDTDNLAGSLKASRDEVALWLGTGDAPGDPVEWVTEQRRGPWAVEIEVRA